MPDEMKSVYMSPLSILCSYSLSVGSSRASRKPGGSRLDADGLVVELCEVDEEGPAISDAIYDVGISSAT